MFMFWQTGFGAQELAANDHIGWQPPAQCDAPLPQMPWAPWTWQQGASEGHWLLAVQVGLAAKTDVIAARAAKINDRFIVSKIEEDDGGRSTVVTKRNDPFEAYIRGQGAGCPRAHAATEWRHAGGAQWKLKIFLMERADAPNADVGSPHIQHPFTLQWASYRDGLFVIVVSQQRRPAHVSLGEPELSVHLLLQTNNRITKLQATQLNLKGLVLVILSTYTSIRSPPS